MNNICLNGWVTPYNDSKSPMIMMKPDDLESEVMLPEKFVPTPYSVIMGRGKTCSEACGNRRLKVIVSIYIDRYAKSKSKEEKSSVLSDIEDTIHDACQCSFNDRRAGFIRYRNGRWFQVGSRRIREKIAGTIRNFLAERYQSSSKSKCETRRQKRRLKNKIRLESETKFAEKNKDPITDESTKKEACCDFTSTTTSFKEASFNTESTYDVYGCSKSTKSLSLGENNFFSLSSVMLVVQEDDTVHQIEIYG